MQKIGIALGGGGVKGAYQMGAWQALHELGLEYQVVTGSSIGSLNGALMAQGDFSAAWDIWQSMEYNSIFAGEPDPDIIHVQTNFEIVTSGLLQVAERRTYDVSPFERLIRSSLDEKRLRASPVQFGLTTVEYPNMVPHALCKEEIPPGEMADYLLASCACFPIIPMRVIHGVHYLDGGFYDNLPINLAARCGAERVIAVDLGPPGFKRPVMESEQLRVVYVRPRRSLGPIFSFDRKRIDANIRLGYQDLLKAVAGYTGERYTFYPGELEKLYTYMEPDLGLLSRMQGGMTGAFLAGRMMEVRSQEGMLAFQRDFPRLRRMGALLAGMEEAAALFDMPTEPIYHAEKMCVELYLRYRQGGALDAENPSHRMLIELLQDGKNALLAGNATGLLDRRQMAVVMVLQLELAGEDPVMVQYLNDLSPETLDAALFLYLLKRRFTGQG